ncbi:competence protein ComEA [Bacillus sp. BGMRC 2118]|nr:competence protein ComEA [Bacillus sp. BGMRC 2118]
MKYIRKYWMFSIPIAAFLIYVFYTSDTPHRDIKLDEIDHSLKSETVEAKSHEKNSENQIQDMLFVDVKGSVKNPGVYEISSSKRVLDAIEMAGGMTTEADQNGVNLAQKVTDEMVIYVPKQGETPSNVSSSNSNSEQNVVNINSATVEQLDILPGIGPSKAESIIAYREENGNFKSVDDLVNVPGIGEKSLDSLREHITVQ